MYRPRERTLSARVDALGEHYGNARAERCPRIGLIREERIHQSGLRQVPSRRVFGEESASRSPDRVCSLESGSSGVRSWESDRKETEQLRTPRLLGSSALFYRSTLILNSLS